MPTFGFTTVLGLWYMRPSEVTKTTTLKNEPPKNEPYKIYDSFISPVSYGETLQEIICLVSNTQSSK